MQPSVQDETGADTLDHLDVDEACHARGRAISASPSAPRLASFLGAPITAPAALPAGPACVRDMVKALGGEAPWLVSCRCSLAGGFAVHRGHRRGSDDPRAVEGVGVGRAPGTH